MTTRRQRSARGNRRTRAANTARSAQSKRGRGLVRPRTATSWRSTRNSTSLWRTWDTTEGPTRAPDRHQVQQPQRHAEIMPNPRSPLVSDPAPTSGTPHGAGPGHRHRNPLEQQFHRGFTEPGAGLGDRTRRRHLPIVPPVPQKLQPVHELARHLFVRLTEEQVQRQHVVYHHVRRQQPRSFLAFPGFADDIVDDVSMDQAGQHPDCHMVG